MLDGGFVSFPLSDSTYTYPSGQVLLDKNVVAMPTLPSTLWKFFSLLHFKASGRNKYSIQAFHLIAQVNALLGIKLVAQMIMEKKGQWIYII